MPDDDSGPAAAETEPGGTPPPHRWPDRSAEMGCRVFLRPGQAEDERRSREVIRTRYPGPPRDVMPPLPPPPPAARAAEWAAAVAHLTTPSAAASRPLPAAPRADVRSVRPRAVSG